MRVELGAGARAAAGYVAVDLNPRNATVVADALHLPFADRALDGMRAVDVLEHISYRETDAALSEWARVLEPGARLYVQVPDADLIMRWYVNGVALLERCAHSGENVRCDPLHGAQWRLLGGHDDGKYADGGAGDDWRWNAHYSLWSSASLTDALEVAGFSIEALNTNGHPNLCCTARRT